METGRSGDAALRGKSGGRGAKRVTRTYNGGAGLLGRISLDRAGPPHPPIRCDVFKPRRPPGGALLFWTGRPSSKLKMARVARVAGGI
jgi:hypothetical protein